MLKVLYLINHAGKAGTERYVESLITSLNGKYIKAYLAYNEEGLLADRMRAAGIETFRITMKNPFDLKAVMELSKLCKKLDIDVIHAQFLRENYIALLSRLINPKVKVMYTNHFIIPNNFAQRLCNRVLTAMESNIIAVCNKGKEQMIANGVNGKIIKVVFNGVNPDIWGKTEKSTMREEFGIGNDEFVMLCASRFAHDKGHNFLVNSIAELKKQTDNKFKLVLAGDGPLLEEVKQQVKSLQLEDTILFVGFRKDIKNLMDGSDLYINSSEHEALSFLMVEVLAAGLPLIATDMGGNRDIINPETNCGLLVRYDDAKDLAEAISKVMNDSELQKTLRENAKKAVRDRFSLESMVMGAYNLYQDSCKV
jgi:glycosyltransferase involved in cell wall biosynthesis